MGTAPRPTERIAILGTVGIPGRYGGFETLVDNLVRYAEARGGRSKTLTVYCSAHNYPEKATEYHGAQLRYSRFNANGVQSILYDIFTALDAVRRGHKTLLMLGVSGAVLFPFLRLFTNVKIITNVDGIEWRREKWKGLASRFLHWSEALATRYSHKVIADNQGIADYLSDAYGRTADVIAYGGNHALDAAQAPSAEGPHLPKEYALALCRIEPENNIIMILEAFMRAGKPLVIVGNWASSDYGRQTRAAYVDCRHLHLLEAIYDPRQLYQVRRGAWAYIHGHSAGGTNPSLVEMMHFGIPVLAHGCAFNRHTTEEKACYFESAVELAEHLNCLNPEDAIQIGSNMREIAQRKYTWNQIGRAYFELLDRA